MRYVLHPGPVVATDGEQHYISAGRLAMLHGLSLYAENVVVYRRGYYAEDGDVHLYPDPKGRYSL